MPEDTAAEKLPEPTANPLFWIRRSLQKQLADPMEEIKNQQEILSEEVRKQQEEINGKPTVTKVLAKPRRIYRQPSKRVGLTKIRLEDCLRCDACSSLYVDPQDYYKHMRNFHQKYNTVIPRSMSRNKYRCTYETREPAQPPVSTDRLPPPKKLTPVENSIIKQNIKNQWSRVLSRRLNLLRLKQTFQNGMFPVVKEEPEADPDMSYLLSQVEVKIKTEPNDY